MAILFLTALAAGVVALPRPIGDPKYWLGFNEYPLDELRADRGGEVYYKALINPAGKAELCVIERATMSTGDQSRFCGRVKSSFRYKPVTGPDGLPTYFLRKERWYYFLPDVGGKAPPPSGADFEIDVQSLPKALNGRVEVRVNVAVNAAGNLTQCDAPAEATQAALAKLACDQLPTIWAVMPEKNATGEPIAYVRQMRVEFREAGAPAN